MKEEIYKICTKLNDGQIAVIEAQEQLLLLLNVVGRSEQCAHEYKVDDTSDIPFDLICKKCGKKS